MISSHHIYRNENTWHWACPAMKGWWEEYETTSCLVILGIIFT